MILERKEGLGERERNICERNIHPLPLVFSWNPQPFGLWEDAPAN